jgi:hypothetical protein
MAKRAISQGPSRIRCAPHEEASRNMNEGGEHSGAAAMPARKVRIENGRGLAFGIVTTSFTKGYVSTKTGQLGPKNVGMIIARALR